MLPAVGGRCARKPGQVRKEAAVAVTQRVADGFFDPAVRHTVTDDRTYRVLARKYRPRVFADLVGQEALVRTLSNAVTSGRIAHAFLLTGIRGIGKTTTARIIARALNCVGENGDGGPTVTPCGVCANCVQILQDRHMDVIEMDAASRTGVDHMRELIESVHYAPVSARYKVYIIDEVHMLSTAAFNALLKTLEEPPPHVIFIFATTETRKIPVTILSRCQRFDLKRLGTEGLAAHLENICGKERVSAEGEALRLIAMAAEGSVRDGLSLLDQAIAHSIGEDGIAGAITGRTVRSMLGLSDRTRLFAMLEHLFAGEAVPALDLLAAQYRDGADMAMLLADMLGIVHSVTRMNLAPASDLGPAFDDHEKECAKRLAGKLGIHELTRAWQLLAKGQEEVKRAADGLTTAEMALIRFAYASRLPGPAEVIRGLKESSTPAPRSPSPSGPAGGGTGVRGAAQPASAPRMEAAPQTVSAPHLSLAAANPAVHIGTFKDILSLCAAQREAVLAHHLRQTARVVDCVPGVLTLSQAQPLSSDMGKRLTGFLTRQTDIPWRIAYSGEAGAPTVAERQTVVRAEAVTKARRHPLVQAVLDAFPGATLEDVRPDVL